MSEHAYHIVKYRAKRTLTKREQEEVNNLIEPITEWFDRRTDWIDPPD